MTDPTALDTSDDVLNAYLAANMADVLTRLNDDFEDSILMVCQVLADCPQARRVEVTSLDARGVDVSVTDPDGVHAHRVEFAAAVHGPDELTAALFELVLRARAQSGESETTTAEREMAELASIRTFLTSVESITEVHPHLRRITFAGGDLHSFTTKGRDTFVYLLAPPPGCDRLVIDQSFTWDEHARLGDDVRPIGAYYTVRQWDATAARLEILAVVHGDEGAASAWVANAAPGAAVALWGPRAAYSPPATTDHVLLVADDTGLPAVAVILEQLPAGVTATVVAEVDRPEEEQALPGRRGVDVHWNYRHGAAPGTTTLLVDAVRRLPPPSPTTYVWGGGESRAMTAVRRYVRDVVGLPRESVELVAYWRHDRSPPSD